MVEHAGTPYPLIRQRHNAKFEVDHTDGIGTKGVLHYHYKTWKDAVQDAMAMNLNDLLAVRAIPYKLQNHLVMSEDNHDAIVEIIEELAKSCIKYDIAMTGGETSIMETTAGMDLTLTVTGFCNSLRGSTFPTGSVLIGLKSSGVHSNGFTKVRQLIKGDLLRELSVPTKIYYDSVFPQLEHIEGVLHIAGGGFARLKDVLMPNQIAVIGKWDGLKVFDELWNFVSSHPNSTSDDPDLTMYTTFNCGIGMILAVDPKKADHILSTVGGQVIGSVEEGAGEVVIHSIFSGKVLRLHNSLTN